MHRRALLLAVAGLSGCTSLVGRPLGGGSDQAGGSSGSDSGSTGTESTGDGGTGAEADEASDPASEPQTPSPAELRRMSVPDLLALSRDNLSRAVETYADAAGDDSLTAVTAATDAFDPGPVVDYLYGARQAYEAADRQGVSTADRAEIDRLGRVEEFLRLSIDAQVLLIEAHNDLEGVVTARQERASGAVTDLSNSRYERSIRVVDTLSRDEYREKRDQLKAETAVLGDVHEALASVVEGVRLFARARGRRRSGAPYAAADLGRDAATAFDRGGKALRDVGSRIPRQAQGFDGVVASLRAATADGGTEARAFYRDIEA